MRCTIEYAAFLIGEEEQDVEIELLDGLKLELGRGNNTCFVNPKMDKVQVICEADFERKDVLVTRIGTVPSTQDNGEEIRIGKTVRIADGSSFYLMDTDYEFSVTFYDGEDMSCPNDSSNKWPDDVYIGNVAYDPDSHSYEREIEHLVYDDELILDTDDEVDELPMD